MRNEDFRLGVGAGGICKGSGFLSGGMGGICAGEGCGMRISGQALEQAEYTKAVEFYRKEWAAYAEEKDTE